MNVFERRWIVCLVLGALTAFTYHRVAAFDFVDYDDPHYILDSPIAN
jgi:hypothetical protein